MPRGDRSLSSPRASYVFVLIASTVFVSETLVMLYLPVLLPGVEGLVKATADAFVLILLIAPVLWFVVIAPLRRGALAERMRTAAAMEAAANGIIITDREGTIIWTNPALAKMTGYSRQECIGKTPRILNSGRHKASFFRQLWQTILSGNVWQGVMINRRKDGALYTEEQTITPVKNDRGEIDSFIAIKQDITEREEAERKLRKSQEELRRAQKMEAVGRLAGGVAHDFNNLLTAILGYSDLLLSRTGERHPSRKEIEEIIKAGQRAASLVRQLLVFSRRQVLEPKVLDLNEVVASTEKLLRRLIGEDISLTTRLGPNLGRVKTDPGHMEQIIMNLAVNARDAMPEGGKLTIETANVELDNSYARGHLAVHPGSYVMLAVSDTGCGMDAATQARIFEPFFTTKGEDKGTGLGLSIVYGIVKQSKGNIWVYSEPGLGATFKIYLPQVQDVVEVVQSAEEHAPAPRGSEIVLLAEDEEIVRKIAREVLESSGYTVLEARHGDHALQILVGHDGPIHLLLADVIMPRLGGFALAERAVSLRPDMKVLYMSGHAADAIAHLGVLDVDGAFIQKPFTPNALVCKIREVLAACPESSGKRETV